ncbi:MAG: EAL domain-containing protein [Gammaproteobacteria bacterium]|nr:EAL domain-containing protein [Gammaproteobacteria bacterium]
MSDADAACYIAKESGRNKIHIYKQGDEDIATRHGEMTWVNRIQYALNNDRFVLMTQSIASARDIENGPMHFEILIRMLDDDDNMISPGQFLPAAERYNLSPEIDRWVVTNTFKWLSENKGQLQALDLCSINLSGNTLSDDGFSDFLLQQFVSYRIPSEKICFEITETSAISNIDIAQRFIHSFSNELRCKFSLDDFGTGLSSFAYLKSMPVDFIKIDGQFVRDITSDPIDMAMVRSINEIGQIMGKKTIAEFVENEKILNQLKLIGIDYVQGYHISRPRPLSQLGKKDIRDFEKAK